MLTMSQQIDELFDVFEDEAINKPNDSQTYKKTDTLKVNEENNVELNEVLHTKQDDKNRKDNKFHNEFEKKNNNHEEEYHNGEIKNISNKKDEKGYNKKDNAREDNAFDNANVVDRFNIRLVMSGQDLEKIVGERVKAKIYDTKNKNESFEDRNILSRRKTRRLEEKENENATNEKEEQNQKNFCADIRDLLVQEHPIENSRTLKDEDSLILEEFLSDKNCIHKCVRPKNYVHKVLTEAVVPARTYKFQLDTFQRKSIECLERSESVLVSAHTSAGKTVIAEYAIALGLRDKQRVIYTSPIKALSNQKYRDLHEEFEDVGLITGDISINPEASVIVMTTEILRSMLYRGSALTKEVRWVIFDEIHYMRDRERGVIWEETIILLPLMVRFIFLSATIPNGIQFAEWVSTIKNQACHIIYTDYRPTPLQHYVYPTGKESVILICDEHGKFNRENFIEAANAVNDDVTDGADNFVHSVTAPGNVKKSRIANKNVYKMKKRMNDIEKIVKMCHARHYTPLIVFAFSKKECEMNANTLSKIDLTNESEKTIIDELFKNAIQILSDDDRNLPQIRYILPLLMRGIGIHHGGLLPIIKEIIEIMFQESLLKVLFSTETFSMGINMPAKTVVFTSLEKFDGVEKRTVSSGEYIQMAGRAGRRGLDDRGIVIILLDKYIHWKQAEQLFTGESNRLTSQFHLGYNMILNLLRIEGVTPDYMIERSFLQYQTKKSMYEFIVIKHKIEKEMNRVYNALNCIYVDDKGLEMYVPPKQDPLISIGESGEDTQQQKKNINQISTQQHVQEEKQKWEISENQTVDFEKLKNCTTAFTCASIYYNTKKKLLQLGNAYRHFLTQQKVIIPFLCKGRLVFIEENGIIWGWCVFIEGRILQTQKQKRTKRTDKHNNIGSSSTNSKNDSTNDSAGNTISKETNDDEDSVVVIDCWVPYISDKKRKLDSEQEYYKTEEHENKNRHNDNKKEETRIEKKKETSREQERESANTYHKKWNNNCKYDSNIENEQKNKKQDDIDTLTNSLDTRDFFNEDITEEDEKKDILCSDKIFDTCGCNELDNIYVLDDFEEEKFESSVFLNSYMLGYSVTEGKPVPPSYTAHNNVQWKRMTFFLKSICRLSAAILSVPDEINLKSDQAAPVIKERYNALMNFVKKEKLLPIINISKLKGCNKELVETIKNIEDCEQALLRNKLRKNKNFNKFYLMYLKYIALQHERNYVDNSILKCRNIVLKKQLKQMLSLMKNMKYIELTQRMNFTKPQILKDEQTKVKEKNKEDQNIDEEEDGQERTKEIEKNNINQKQTEKGEKGEEEEKETVVLHMNSLLEHQELMKSTSIEGKSEKGYVVTMKGQIASAISSVDELVISELFFSNFFSQYSAEYVAAFLSCFVFDEKKTNEVSISDKILVEGHKQIINTAKRIAEEMEKCDMSIDLNGYLEKFKPEIMTTVLNWMKGSSFLQLQVDSHIYEGSIIRTLRRLDELLRQMICAFRGISNENMCKLLLSASKKLRRGIPFSPSLYL